MKKYEIIQMPLLFDPSEPDDHLAILEIEDGIITAQYEVKLIPTFPEFKMNPFLLN